MDDTTEKYPVCPHRNTTAAFRWFFQPAAGLDFLRARKTSRPAAADLLAAPPQASPERRTDW
jgi:hypothetical protein